MGYRRAIRKPKGVPLLEQLFSEEEVREIAKQLMPQLKHLRDTNRLHGAVTDGNINVVVDDCAAGPETYRYVLNRGDSDYPNAAFDDEHYGEDLFKTGQTFLELLGVKM